MANDDLSEEIKLLRTQLADLKKRQDTEKTEKARVEKEQEEEQAAEAEQAVAAAQAADGDVSHELIDQFRDLLDSIDKDIKDAKPTTLLIIFALGILVGRL